MSHFVKATAFGHNDFVWVNLDQIVEMRGKFADGSTRLETLQKEVIWVSDSPDDLLSRAAAR